MMRDAPIGFFDSGLGGLTVRQEVLRLMPAENTLYLADSAHAPYGEKSREEILGRSRKNTEWLLERGSKLIVVACNTATTNAIAALRQEYEVPFIGIEPAIKPAALGSESRCVGVLATRGTLSSSLFANTSRMYAQGIEVVEQEGTGLVRMIESGAMERPETTAHLRVLLAPMIDAGIDHLVLGCTHYPLLIPQLRQILPGHVRIVDCSPAVALQTRAVLSEKGMLRGGMGPGKHLVYTNGDPEIADVMLGRLGHPKGALPIG
jgi:glutamate racemase